MRTLIAAILLLQAAPPQSEKDKLEAALKKFGERTYRISDLGTEVGTVTLRSRIQKEGDRNVAVLEVEFKIKVEGQEVAMTFAETAELDGLRFVSARRTGSTPDGRMETQVTVKDGKAVIKDGDDETTHAIGRDTIGDLAPFWLLCAAEQKKDATFKRDVLNLIMPGYEPGHVYTCAGPETIDVGGRKVETFKWTEKGEWKHPMKIDGKDMLMPSKVDNSYWVGAEGCLVRFTSGRTELTLVTK